MSKRIDLNGRKFGRLTVLYEIGPREDGAGIEWACKCECGNWTVATTNNLRKGAVKSCGCMKKELTATKGYQNIYKQMFNTYHNLRRACYDETGDKFSDFGAKGIAFCKEWLDSVDAFKEWSIQNGYTPKSQLLRYDQDKGYNPDNCYWWERTAEKPQQ